MWLKKLKKKKLQCFLIGVLLFLSSLIFSSSLSMMTSISGYVNQYYSSNKFYNLICFNANESSKEEVLKWSNSNSEVNATKAIEVYSSGNDLYHQGKNIKLSMYDVEVIEDYQNLPFGLIKINSLNNSSCPKEGEVWTTQLMAEEYNITLGDNLTFKTKTKDVTLKVTSLINDSLQPSAMSSLTILYINKNNAQDFSTFTKSSLVFINVKDDAKVVVVEKDLTATLKDSLIMYDKNLLITNSIMISSVMGGISALASLFIFIASVLFIRFIIWNNILKEYKSIGTYKALGFSKGKIYKIYIIGYSVIAFAGSSLGAIFSIPVLNYTATKVLKYIGNFHGAKINVTVILVTTMLFTLTVIINLYFVVKKTNKITPVEAHRTGVTSSRKKLAKSMIKDTTSPIALAINDIFKYKKLTTYITLTLTLALTLIIFFGNFNVTVLKMKENSSVWFGLAKSGLTISSPIGNTTGTFKEALEKVKGDNRIKNYVYGSMYLSGKMNIVLDTKKYSIKSTIYDAMAMNSYDSDLGFTTIHGHNPENYKEVAVGITILKDAGLSTGDYIELSINNKKATYLISGSYNAINDGGNGIRLLNAAVEKEFPEFIGSEIYVNLKDGVDKEAFKKEINDKYFNLDASDIHPIMKPVIESIPGILLPISSLLIVVFLAFSSIVVLNIIIMNIRDNRRNFGIMKSLGFTYKDLRNRYLYRILILTSFSIILASTLNLIFGRKVFAAAITIDALIISPITMLALIMAMTLLILTITLICCGAIKNTKPTELMEE